jgi:tetraprenyl-beta-curcumene synthase
MDGVIRKCGLVRSAGFARAASRYWLTVFPAVARELRHRRELAMKIPDPVLRRVALEALECKRCNIEGAAAVELLAGSHSSRALIRALTACQTMCDYLDLLAEQPAEDPVANGYRLHEALIEALATEGRDRDDYYAYSPHRRDGGYLQALVRDVRQGLACLPRRALVDATLVRAAERIAVYQSFNHGDRHGSHEPFKRWAQSQVDPDGGVSWWETAAAIGSTLLLFALISSAARPDLTAEQVARIEAAYFPWIVALHTLLDSLVDLDEDHLAGGHRLIDRYRSPAHAAERMSSIAGEALDRCEGLPGGVRHRLLVIAMTGFYLCQAREGRSAHSRAVVPALLSAVGGLGSVAMGMMRVRHAMHRPPRPQLVLSIDTLQTRSCADCVCGE